MDPKKDRDERKRKVVLTLAMIVASVILMIVILWTIVERASKSHPRVPNHHSLQHAQSHLQHFGGGVLQNVRLQLDDAIKVASQGNSIAAHKPSTGVLGGIQTEYILGGSVDFAAEYAGYVVLVVNVASKCGFTANNYDQLEAMHRKFKSRKFTVAAFPCNQFANQEPGSAAEIMRFARKEKGATFPIFAKIDVNGPQTHPLFARLKSSLNVTAVEWNFGKFLIGRDGTPLRYFNHDYPFPGLITQIQALLD